MAQKFSPDNPFKANSPASARHASAGQKAGLKIEHSFSTAGVHPFDEIQWEIRSAKISSETGQAVFEQNNIEVPAFWSQLAAKVW
jgi:ribonucleoside-diphosphate reductase alpha chain